MATKDTKKNIFAAANATRQQEQSELRAKINNDMPVKTNNSKKVSTKKAPVKDEPDNVARTSMTLSLSEEDKKNLKILAMNRGITSSKLLHIWITEAMENE